MSLTGIIGIAKEYLVLGTIGAVILAVLFLAGYFGVYQKIMKGKKRLSIGKLTLFLIFFVYLAVVFGAVFGSRGGGFGQAQVHWQPFSSYREAWYTFSARAWRNLILNILMFLPMGGLLPFVFQKCRKFWITYLAGFGISVLIEFVQFVTKRGVVEFDDVFNNTLGTMIGYGLAVIVLTILLRQKGQMGLYKKAGLACLQLPLIISVVAFALLFGIYSQKELGNLRLMNYERKDMSKISLIVKCDLNEQDGTESVYRAKILTQEETLSAAKKLFAVLNTQVDVEQTDIYDETAVYYSEDRNYSLWVDYQGPKLWFTAFRLLDETGVTGLSLDEVREILEKYDVAVPPEVEFSEGENGRYELSAQMIKSEDALEDGTCSVTIVSGNRIASINNGLILYTKYKDFEIISEKEAYDLLTQGRFLQIYADAITKIEVTDVRLSYEADSKGFYQPVYLFTATFNGTQEGILRVPALQNK